MIQESSKVIQTISALDDILNRIDSANTKPSKVPRVTIISSNDEDPDSNKRNLSNTITPSSILQEQAPSIKWMEYFDAESRKNYYYNIDTKETTWEKPTLFIPVPTKTYSSSTSTCSDEYRFTGAFNRHNGRFSTLPSHLFTENGQIQDRSLRQLGHYMDINELEKNRQQAKAIKEEGTSRLPPKGAGSWKEYNKERKEGKKRKLLDSLLS